MTRKSARGTITTVTPFFEEVCGSDSGSVGSVVGNLSFHSSSLTGTGLNENEGIDLMPYFSPSVFSGYGDDEQVSLDLVILIIGVPCPNTSQGLLQSVCAHLQASLGG